MGTQNDAPPRLTDLRDLAAGHVKIDTRTAPSATASLTDVERSAVRP